MNKATIKLQQRRSGDYVIEQLVNRASVTNNYTTKFFRVGDVVTHKEAEELCSVTNYTVIINAAKS